LVYNDGSKPKRVRKKDPYALMKKVKIFAILLSFILSACGVERPPTPVPIKNVTEFRQALESAGVEVESLDRPAPELPMAEAQLWGIHDELIYIYAFSGEQALSRVVDELISKNGFFPESSRELKVWGHNAFIVVYPGSDGGTVLLISALLGDPEMSPIVGPDEPYPPAVSAAQHTLADELNLRPADVKVLDYEAMIWADSCLGLGEDREECAEVETPGWRIQLLAGDEEYTLHSDAVGTLVKRVNR
jgi:hypothetical protein